MPQKPKAQRVALTDKHLDQVKDQILIILADYQGMSAEFVRHENTRIEIANRILDNMRIIGSKAAVRKSRK